MSQPRIIRTDTREEFPLEYSETIIGRGPDCAVVVDHPSVSSRHAAVFCAPDGKNVIRDLGSKNGIYINQQRITEARLASEQIFKVGAVVFKFVQHASSPPPLPIEGAPEASRELRDKPSMRGKLLTRSLRWWEICLVIAGLWILALVRGQIPAEPLRILFGSLIVILLVGLGRRAKR